MTAAPSGRALARGPETEGQDKSILGPLPLTTEERAEADQSDQGVTATVVLEAVQLLASSVSTTVFGPSAQASRK